MVGTESDLYYNFASNSISVNRGVPVHFLIVSLHGVGAEGPRLGGQGGGQFVYLLTNVSLGNPIHKNHNYIRQKYNMAKSYISRYEVTITKQVYK